jgi:RNA polymerase sigma factor (sigma-70 family)
VTDVSWLAEPFERNRAQLRALAYRLLGSLADADDVVQDTWLKLSRADTSAIKNLDAWLTTVAARVCLDVLRARKSRGEKAAGLRLPDPIVTPGERLDPEQQVLLGSCVGLALLVVMQALAPAERVAYVLHDMFDVSFDDIAAVLGRTSLAARKLASRARRRVQGVTISRANMEAHRNAVEAFRAAAHDADFERLLAVLDPNIVLRSDRGAGVLEILGARKVAERALAFANLIAEYQVALVNGTDGLVAVGGQSELISVLAFTVAGGRITEFYVLADRARLDRLATPPQVYAAPLLVFLTTTRS